MKALYPYACCGIAEFDMEIDICGALESIEPAANVSIFFRHSMISTFQFSDAAR